MKNLGRVLSFFSDCFGFNDSTQDINGTLSPLEGSESFESHSELLSKDAHEWFMKTGYMDFQMGDFSEPQYGEVRALFDKIDQIYKANDVKTFDNPRQQFLLKGKE